MEHTSEQSRLRYLDTWNVVRPQRRTSFCFPHLVNHVERMPDGLCLLFGDGDGVPVLISVDIPFAHRASEGIRTLNSSRTKAARFRRHWPDAGSPTTYVFPLPLPSLRRLSPRPVELYPTIVRGAYTTMAGCAWPR